MVKNVVVIFLLNLILSCNYLFTQVPSNNFCDSAQLLCPNSLFLGTTWNATADTCTNCSDLGLFSPFVSNKTVWYYFKTNEFGDSLKIILNNVQIPPGVDNMGALQLRLVQKNNSCDKNDFNLIGSTFNSTSVDTTFIYSQLLPNNEYGLVLNENTPPNTLQGISFSIKIEGEAVQLSVPSGLISQKDTICLNEVALYELSLTDCPFPEVIEWYINDQLITAGQEMVFETNEVKDGDTVKVITRCYSHCADPIVIKSNPVNVFSFYISAGNDTIINPGETAQLHAQTDSPNYYWDTQMFISSPSTLEPFVFPTQTFTYPFVAFSNGCIQYDYVTVFVRNGLEIPNTFSPNGDELNDSWKIPDIELYPKNRLSIYNRYGYLLESYEPYEPSNQWSGTYEGSPLPEGVYFYILELNDTEKTIYKGTVTIIR